MTGVMERKTLLKKQKNNLESVNAVELLVPPYPYPPPVWSMNSQAWLVLSKTSLLNEAPTIAQN